MRNQIFSILLIWVPLAIVITAMSGLVEVAVQQDLRQSANDPQIQIAEDAATVLINGQTVPQLQAQPVDISQSLSPFVINYNSQGEAVSSNAVLDGAIPVPPSGVFLVAKANGENRITWEPKPGVRIASVIRYYNGAYSGFILAGRSLREVEIREDTLLLKVIIAWMATLIGSLLAIVAIKVTGRLILKN